MPSHPYVTFIIHRKVRFEALGGAAHRLSGSVHFGLGTWHWGMAWLYSRSVRL